MVEGSKDGIRMVRGVREGREQGCRDEGGREGESAGMRVGGKGRVQG